MNSTNAGRRAVLQPVEDFPKARIFCTGRSRPIDQFHPLQIGTRGKANTRKGIGRIGVERVQEKAIGGRVWADVPAVGRKQAMDRTNRHRVGTMTRGRTQQAAQRRRVADPTIAFTGQRVELHRQAPTPASSGNIGNRHAAARRHSKLHFAVGKAKPVIARGLDPRSDQGRPLPAQRQRAARAVLLHQLRNDITDDPSRRQPKCPARRSRHERWRSVAALAGKQAVAAVTPFGSRGAGKPQCPQDPHQGLERDALWTPCGIGPIAIDSGSSREGANRCFLHRPRSRNAIVEAASSQPMTSAGDELKISSPPWSGARAWASFPRLLATVRSDPSPMAQRATTARGPITSAPRARAPSRRGTIVDRRKRSNSA